MVRMESSKILAYVGVFLAGAAVSGGYFAALWWTVQRMMEADRPALLFAGSFVVRVAFALGTFYLIMDGRWQRLAVALGGFILVRLVVVKRFMPVDQQAVTAGDEAS